MPIFDPYSIPTIPEAEYISPQDFSAAYLSENTITLVGAPAIINNSELIYILVVPASGNASRLYIQGVNNVAFSLSAGVLTMNGVPSPFAVGDVYRIGIGAKPGVVLHGDVNVDSTSVDTSGLVGKSSGGDFDTAFASATTIACTNMPTYHPNLLADDIVTVMQVDSSGAVVNTYSRDDMPITVAANVVTVVGAGFAASDTFVIYTNVERFFDSINLEMVDGANVDVGAGNAGMGTQRISIATDDVNQTAIKAAVENIEALNAARMPADRVTHTSPNDFDAAFATSTTITLAGYPTELVSGEQIVKITQLKADNTYAEFVNGENCSLAFSAGVITIYGAGTPFVTGDDYRVGLILQDKTYDDVLEASRTSEQSPASGWYTNKVNLVTASAIGSANDSWVNQGSEIDMTGKTDLAIWVNFVANDSTGNQIRFLAKHTSGSTDTYVMADADAYSYTLGDSDIKIVLLYLTNNLIDSVQVQTKATIIDTGGGTVATATIDVTKSWR